MDISRIISSTCSCSPDGSPPPSAPPARPAAERSSLRRFPRLCRDPGPNLLARLDRTSGAVNVLQLTDTCASDTGRRFVSLASTVTGLHASSRMTVGASFMDDITIDEALVRSLLHEQHPDFAGLELREVAGGWDNQMWRLGDDLAVRLPRTPRAPTLCAPNNSGCPSWPRVCRCRYRFRCGSANRRRVSPGPGLSRDGLPANPPTGLRSAAPRRPTVSRLP